MKIKSEKDFWSGLMFIAVGVGFAWGATAYSFGGACEREVGISVWECMQRASARPGPAYFPFGLGLLLAVLGGMVLFKSLTFEVEGGDKIGRAAWRPLIIVVASVAAFGFLLPRLGMFISLPLLVLASATASEEFHWKDALINATLLTIFCWLIFIYGLKLTIPLYPSIRGFGG